MGRTLLSINDSAWLYAETRRTPMQVGMLATFRVPPDRPGFVADLVARWRETRQFLPPYNYRFRRLPVPSWTELADDQIDLDYHLRHSALPDPGSQRELGVLVSRLHSAPMDRRYPLWECHVIEGLEEDRWSLYFKAHHSQVDGVGGVRLLRRMLSVDPERRDMLPPWAVGTHGPDQSGLPPRAATEPEAERLAEEADRESLLGDLASGLAARVRTGASVTGSLARTYAESLTGLRDDRDRAVPFRAPRSILNGRIHAPRRFATQHYDVERLRAAADAADASLNDVYLAICGGALRRYLLGVDALPAEDLTANVPVSVRPEGGARVGNALTFLYARLGTTIEDPVARVAGDQCLHGARQDPPAPGGRTGDGRLHHGADAAVPVGGDPRHRWARTTSGQRGRLERAGTRRDPLPRRLHGRGDLPRQPALQRPGAEHHRRQLRRLVQHRLHRLPRLHPPPAAHRRLRRRGAGAARAGPGPVRGLRGARRLSGAGHVRGTSAATPLLVLALLLAGGLALALVGWLRERRAHAATRERVATLEADLDAALRPPSPGTGVERAVRRVVRTAAQLRAQGVGGLLQSSLEELQTWATEGRSQVANLAAPDGTVTLFFSDIEGSTELNAQLGDDAFVKVLTAHDALVRSRVERHRGQVVKTAGDGFMVAFRDAEAACRAALAIQHRLSTGRETRLRRARVAVRIGIHTGTAVSRDGDYFGRNVAMAARLGSIADGGQVLASAAVRDALDDDAAVRLDPAGDAELRGLPGRHEVFRVEARSGLRLDEDG